MDEIRDAWLKYMGVNEIVVLCVGEKDGFLKLHEEILLPLFLLL